jgi:RND family efflux transporter MFP subunit
MRAPGVRSRLLSSNYQAGPACALPASNEGRVLLNFRFLWAAIVRRIAAPDGVFRARGAMTLRSARSLWLAATAPALALLIVACQAKQSAPEVTEPYRVASPVVTTAVYEREYVGEIQATQRVELRARLQGIVESVAVDEGQQVRTGQLLFSVSAREHQQEVQKARAVSASSVAELRAAQIEQANMKMLLENKIVAETEVAMADSKVSLLEAKLAEARAGENQAAINLTYARVQAPFDGVVNRLPKKVGSLVGQGDLLTTITNTKDVFVYFRVSEQEYFEYMSRGAAERPTNASLRLANGQMYASSGIIDTVESEFDKDTGNIAFRARFKNEDGVLKHGSTGTVILRSELKDRVVIPQAATFEVQDQLYVYTVDSENTARIKRVIPKARIKDTFVLESGLGPEDRFVTEGIQKLRDGVKIAVTPNGPSAHSAL